MNTYDLDGTTGLNDLPLSSELLSDEEVAEELNMETISIADEDSNKDVCVFVNIEAQDIFRSELFGHDSVLLPNARYVVTVEEIKEK